MDILGLLERWFDPIRTIFMTAYDTLLPVLAGLIVLMVGAFLARLIKDLVASILHGIQIEALLSSLRVPPLLKNAGIDRPVAELLSVLLYWILMLGVGIAAITQMGIRVDATSITMFGAFLPAVITGVFIIIVGATLGTFMAGLVGIICAHFNYVHDSAVRTFTKYSIVLFAILEAINRLGLPGVNSPQVMTAIGIAAALALGLGGQKMAGDALKRLLTDKTRTLEPTKGGKKRR
jgi:hypothetical protein